MEILGWIIAASFVLYFCIMLILGIISSFCGSSPSTSRYSGDDCDLADDSAAGSFRPHPDEVALLAEQLQRVFEEIQRSARTEEESVRDEHPPNRDHHPATKSQLRRKYCEVLGVAVSATAAEIKGAHRRSVRLWHPDRLDGMASELRATAAERLAEINKAYSVLSHPSTADNALKQPSKNQSRPSLAAKATGSSRAKKRAAKPVPRPVNAATRAKIAATLKARYANAQNTAGKEALVSDTGSALHKGSQQREGI